MEGMCHDPLDSAAIRGTLAAVVFSRLVSFTRYRMFAKVMLHFCLGLPFFADAYHRNEGYAPRCSSWNQEAGKGDIYRWKWRIILKKRTVRLWNSSVYFKFCLLLQWKISDSGEVSIGIWSERRILSLVQTWKIRRRICEKLFMGGLCDLNYAPNNLVPRASHLTALGKRGETLVGSGHVLLWQLRTPGRGPM